jgi:DNA repair protein RadC
MNNPQAVADYLSLQIGGMDREVFGVMFLNAQHRLIAFEVLFQGTLTQTSVHPREVARRALELNAASIVVTHNHPSGVVTPSNADFLLTEALQRVMGLIGVRVLDHLIVCGVKHYSFCVAGQLKPLPASEMVSDWLT